MGRRRAERGQSKSFSGGLLWCQGPQGEPDRPPLRDRTRITPILKPDAPNPAPSMDYRPTPQHELLRQTVREFCRREVVPIAKKIDEDDEWPDALTPKLAAQGLLGVTVPEDLGGAGLDTVSYAI